MVSRLDAEALPARLARAMEANLEQPLRLKELAWVQCMSPRGLTAACRRHGLPAAMAQVAEMRLQHARALLAGGGRDSPIPSTSAAASGAGSACHPVP